MNAVRIGNGCGFWGDNLDAPVLLTKEGRLDYLTLEYLAELTMSILAQQKQRDPQAGFAHDFLDVLRRLGPILADQPQLKIVTNAGGMNPRSCAERAAEILRAAGVPRRIACIDGDDLLPRLDELLDQGHSLENLDTGAPLSSVRERVVSANAYLGARPIAEALQQGAEIVITGRVADASLTVGPAMYELGWDWNDWDRLAAATVAGHLIECGAQVTGGLWHGWRGVDLANVGYPIAEIRADGAVFITKPENTGGIVSEETVAEQLLYEVGDPAAYLTPDVVADFAGVSIRQSAANIVEVTGASGQAATDSYKVSIAYRDGFTAAGTLVVYGPDAVDKAEACGRMIFDRLRRAGCTYARSLVECLGAGGAVPIEPLRRDVPEVVLRVAVHDPDRQAVERFSKELAPLVTSGPPGVTGYTGGRPKVREVFAYWPALIAKSAVEPQVHFLD